jgi:hypothetical protein
MFHKRPKLAEPNTPATWAETGAWRGWEPPLNVVRGESRRQDVLARYCGPPNQHGYLVPIGATLCREPGNPVDRNAIRVEVDGAQVGYIAEEIAAQMSPLLDRGKCAKFSVAAVIRGGAVNAPSLGMHLWLGRRITPGPNVVLDQSARGDANYAVRWRDEAIRPPAASTDGPQRDVAGVHTGGSVHAGKWTGIDQRDLLVTIKAAREFLRLEADPLERHFAYNLLEEALYKCRDTISGALEDFQVVCEQHHQEMAVIRPALIAFFGRIPLLPTYRQMAIARGKAGDRTAAADWCQRGLDVYGDDALEIGSLEDLRKRLAKLSAK